MDESTTRDGFFGGVLMLDQPAKGHRIGTDAVLLAAAAPQGFRRACDLGSGVGCVGLRAAQVEAGAEVVLADNDPDILALAERNIVLNRLEPRVFARNIDVSTRISEAFRASFDLVLTNPPFADKGAVRASPHPRRAAAHVLSGDLDGWIRRAASLLGAKGEIVVIHRADALEPLVKALSGRFGGLQVRPVHPRADAPAHRLLVRGRLGSRAPLVLLPGLVLHGPDGQFTPEADAIHCGAARIEWM